MRKWLRKREKKKGNGVFLFSFSGVWIDREVSNFTSLFSYFRPLPCNQTAHMKNGMNSEVISGTYRNRLTLLFLITSDTRIHSLECILCMARLAYLYVLCTFCTSENFMAKEISRSMQLFNHTEKLHKLHVRSTHCVYIPVISTNPVTP